MKNMFAYLIAALALLAGPAFAVVDVSAATGLLSGDGATAIAAVGGALIALAGLAVVFKWVKASIFG